MDVVYASETGNACDVAERIWMGGRARRLAHCTLRTCDQYAMHGAESTTRAGRLLVLVCSTAGQGDPPTNAQAFWKQIMRRSLPPDALLGLRYAALGLGDSSYRKFNFCAKKLHRRLTQLGAVSQCDVGLADDQHELGADTVCDRWIDELWTTVAGEQSAATVEHKEVLLPSRYELRFVHQSTLPGTSETDASLRLQLVDNQRVTAPDHWQDTRLLCFSNCHADARWHFEPGDVLTLKPENLAESVDMFVRATGCGESLDRVFTVHTTSAGVSLPCGLAQSCTLRLLLSAHFDLQAVPKRGLFKWLHLHATDGEERERLHELCTSIDDYFDYCCRPRRTVAESMRDFAHSAAQLPLAYYFDALPHMRHRAFSIASSPTDPHLQLLVAVVRYRSRMSADRLGLCSNWLARMQVPHRLYATIRRGTLKFSSQPGPPTILIGPGTGVAPFRSYLRSVDACSEHSLLFFGCRNRHNDYYFENEWLSLPVRIVCAFSRDSPSKVYVQHKVEEHGGDVADLLRRGARVYIAGNAKEMPDAVLHSLANVAARSAIAAGENGACSGKAFVDNMIKAGVLQMEVWS